MNAPLSSDEASPRALRIVAFVLVGICVAAFIVHMGRLSFFLSYTARSLVLAMELAAIAASAILCIWLRLYAPVILSACVAGYACVQAALFSHNFNTPINLNALSGYFGLASAVVFAPALHLLPNRTFMNLFLALAAAYGVFYLLLSLGVPGFQPPVGGPERDILSIGADPRIGRPERFVMLGSVMAFGACVSLCRMLLERQLLYAPLLLLFCAGIWFSYSRVITLFIGLVLVAYLLTRRPQLIATVAFGLLSLATIVLLIGLASPDFRPFEFFGPYDMSGYVRDMSYMAVRGVIDRFWLFGTGFASDPRDVVALMGTDTFYASDIGPAGVLFEAGALGVGLFMCASAAVAYSHDRLRALAFRTADVDALALTGAIAVLYGVIAPDIWSGSSTLFAGFFFAVALSPRPRPNEVQPGDDSRRFLERRASRGT